MGTWASEGDDALPHTYTSDGHPPPPKEAGRVRVPASWAPAWKYGAKPDTPGDWGPIHVDATPVHNTHRVGYGLPWACMVDPGMNDPRVLQGADQYMSSALLDTSFKGMLMAGAHTMHEKICEVLRCLHAVVCDMHKRSYLMQPAGAFVPVAHAGMFALTHPPYQQAKSLCVDYDPRLIQMFGFSKWMTCNHGWLRLTLGTVKGVHGHARKVQVNAHRFIIFAMQGNAHGGLTGKVVMHTCDNRRCLNPAHLLVGSARENAQKDYTKPHATRFALLASREGGG